MVSWEVDVEAVVGEDAAGEAAGTGVAVSAGAGVVAGGVGTAWEDARLGAAVSTGTAIVWGCNGVEVGTTGGGTAV